MADVSDVCDYIIVKLNEGGVYLNTLKLHKLLYYVQAWALAFYGSRIIDSDFQAWVHGPVNRPIYDRFRAEKTMYSRVRTSDVSPTFTPDVLPETDRRHIDVVLETYADFSDDQLEVMTHGEPPWQEARQGLRPTERGSAVISDETMAKYYRTLLPAD